MSGVDKRGFIELNGSTQIAGRFSGQHSGLSLGSARRDSLFSSHCVYPLFWDYFNAMEVIVTDSADAEEGPLGPTR